MANENPPTLVLNDEQINHMVSRFLAWHFPPNMHPDGGLCIVRGSTPTGTNLLDATQAADMVRNMLNELPAAAPKPQAVGEPLGRGLPVGGYRQQTTVTVATANRIKAMEERVLRFMDDMWAVNESILDDLPSDQTWPGNDYDPRDMAIAQTHFQEGFSALVRSVFKPGRLTDDELVKYESNANG